MTMDLYDFETNFETAAQTILDDSGITAHIRGSEDEIDRGNAVLVEFQENNAIPDHKVEYQGKYYHDIYTGTLSITVQICRPDDPGEIGETTTRFRYVRRKLREIFRQAEFPFTSNNLPCYTVLDILPAGTANTIDADTVSDVCTVQFALVFALNFTTS